ncbi:V-type ATP synthase subunit D [Acholeplasma sp. OttesenSCG-928-E16]|nr:V-type ATP synthase subunit D [Acholeplasma sp. OttesenSCG-928-E16]
MAQTLVATKGNLITLKKSIVLAQTGYDLMNQKRNILIHEMMLLIDEIKKIRDDLVNTYKKAYLALQDANVTLGIVSEIAKTIPVDDKLQVTYRSVMGVDIPKIIYEREPIKLSYGMGRTNTKFDYAFTRFQDVRDLTIKLAEIDNSCYRLANAIRKSQKRANALKNIVIPNFHKNIKLISDSLEEKEREEFGRMKVIKAKKGNKN